MQWSLAFVATEHSRAKTDSADAHAGGPAPGVMIRLRKSEGLSRAISMSGLIGLLVEHFARAAVRRELAGPTDTCDNACRVR